ncbi:MAG TPA: glycosyltransferase family 9 protein [Bacteroidales bacterium]|nr:glycosyltransferase family 9 protein [Bacteroidales bacterium]
MSPNKKNINRFRKKILKVLTKNIGATSARSVLQIDAETVKNVLIIRPNHRLGNQLLMTPLVQEVESTFPNTRIDLFAGKIAPVLFQNYTSVDRIIRIPRKPFKELFNYLKAWARIRTKKYDLVVNVDKNSSSGRLATSFARAKCKLHGENLNEIHCPDYQHIAKNPIYNLRYALSKMGIPDTHKELPNLNLKLSDAELEAGKQLLQTLVENKEMPVISLYTYATGTKCYTKEWWAIFYVALKTRYPNHTILEILPVENISMIDFVAPSFYCKDVRQMAAVMANTAVYVGADCGIMHLASAAPTPTFGFFSVTNPLFYAPYNKGSQAFITNGLENEEIFAELDKLLV